ncbi:hypothetical protein JCM11251_007174 [Rhodosporidiobolus azoricus]
MLLGFVLGALSIRYFSSGTAASRDLHPTSPLNSTLGFSRISVLSLPSRLDRRAEMEKLAHVAGLSFDVVDAVDGRKEEWVQWVEERVGEVRRTKLRMIADAEGVPPASVRNIALARSLLPSEAVPLPDLPLEEDFLAAYLSCRSTSDLQSLPSSLPPRPAPLSDFEVDRVLATSLPSFPERLATIATWHSHVDLWWRFLDQRWGETILILEDDVDVEWEVGKIWAQIQKSLPKDDWDIIYFGDCAGREGENPAYLHPYLHRSTSPVCLHSYALSQRGASRLLNLLHSSPWTAFSSPLDLQLAYLIRHLSTSSLSAFSLEPPLFTQRSDEEEPGWTSDIRTKREEARKWTGVMRDSTVERIARKEGRELKRKKWEEEEFYRFFYGEKVGEGSY